MPTCYFSENEQKSEPAKVEDAMKEDDDDPEKDGEQKISRKKLRKMNRLTVAELKQVI